MLHWKCEREKALESISVIILDHRLIKVIFVIFLFSRWKVIKAAIYMQSKIIFPTSSQLCLLADRITLLNP